MKKSVFVFLCSVILTKSVSEAGVYSGATDDATFTQLLDDVTAKRAELQAKIVEAGLAGLNVQYARVSLVTLDVFKDTHAPWDRANPESIQALYDRSYFSRFDPVGPVALPFDELADCLEMADAAIAELQQQIDGNLKLKLSPDFSTGGIVPESGVFKREGREVIPSKFFWGPFEGGPMEAFGRMGELYIAMVGLEPDLSLNEIRNQNLRTLVEEQVAANRVPIQTFIGHVAHDDFWMKTEHPEVFAYEREFTDYDIDHPIVRTWMEALFEGQLGDARDRYGDAERIHMLANEPNFAIGQGGRGSTHGVSPYTMDKYAAWLETKYGTVSELNDVYGSSFSEFAEVKGVYTIPLAISYRGGPVWYDWMMFNRVRANEWFRFLDETVRAVDPGGMTHVKIWGEGSIHADFIDEGIDVEFISKLVDVTGTDNQSTPLSAEWDLRRQQGWRDRYSLEWRNQAVMLDFVKSIAPDKVFYDSEWHGLSGGRWRDFHIEPDYVRASLWLAAVDGLGAINAWLWNRRADGSVRTDAYVATSDFQPIQLDAFGRTMKELNAHGRAVTSLAPKKRNVLVYYSVDTAIQDGDYPEEMASVYEALKVLNIGVGFTTADEFGSVSADSQIIVVPPTEYMSDEDLLALEAFSAAGGRVVLVDSNRCFLRTHMGVTRSGGSNLSPLGSIDYASPYVMADGFTALLEGETPELPVAIDIRDDSDQAAYGVLVSQYKDPVRDVVFVSLVNVSQEALSVSLTKRNHTGGTPAYQNCLTGQLVEETVLLDPMDVVLLEIGNLTTDWNSFVTHYGLSGELETDFDGDGVMDVLEFLHGGDPADSLFLGSSFEFRRNGAGRLALLSNEPVKETSGLLFDLEWTDSLESGEWYRQWESVEGSSSIESGLESIERVPDVANFDSLFFRYRVMLP